MVNILYLYCFLQAHNYTEKKYIHYDRKSYHFYVYSVRNKTHIATCPGGGGGGGGEI